MGSEAKELARPKRKAVKYTRQLAKHIYSLYMQGYSIEKISKLPGMPTADTIHAWKSPAGHGWFRQLMSECQAERKARRAEEAEEKIHEIANKELSKDEAAGARVNMDAAKWLAEVNDPTKYGKKVTHSGDASNPIKFIVSTGFPEPNEHQRPPRLGSDGLIDQKNSGAEAPSHKEEG